MKENDAFQRYVAERFVREGPGRPVSRAVHDGIVARARETRQRPLWLAFIEEPPMRVRASVAVGSPTARVAAILGTVVLMMAAGVSAGMTGAGPQAVDRDRGGAGQSGPVSSPSPSPAGDPDGEPTAPAEALPSRRITELEQALGAVFGSPESGRAPCRSIREARLAARIVLLERGMADWSFELDPYVRADGCTVAYVRSEGEVALTSTYRPEVKDVLEAFRERSLAECLDAATATRLLTEALEAIGHLDFIVKQMPYVAGPDARWSEIVAHAEGGCIFYTLSSAEEDGTLLYFLNGG